MRLIFVLLVFLTANAAGGTDSIEMGRLFTTPEQRQQLDQARYAVKIKPIELVEKDEDQSEKAEQELNSDPILLRGLIYNSHGRNAAWLNNSSTLDGNAELEGIQINTEKITEDQVPVILKHKNEVIRLKVGESHDPAFKVNSISSKP